MKRIWPMWALVAMLGCDGRSIPVVPPVEGGVLHFDAAMIERPDGGITMRDDDAGVEEDAGTPGVDGGSDPALDRRLFVPDIPLTYSGMLTDTGIELLAWTIREDPVLGDHDFLLAVRNTYGSPLCSLTVDVIFRDSAGTEVGDAGTLVEGPPHRGVSGTGGLVSGCMSDGHVGMMAAPLYLRSGRRADEIASGTYTVGAINLVDAVPTTDITVSGLTTAPGTFRGQHFVGAVENRSRSSTFRNPSVSIFGLNAVGRPLFESGDIDLLTISPGGAWSFSTSPDVEETFASLAWFVRASEL